MAFSFKNAWYLIEHGNLVELVELNTNWMDTK